MFIFFCNPPILKIPRFSVWGSIASKIGQPFNKVCMVHWAEWGRSPSSMAKKADKLGAESNGRQ